MSFLDILGLVEGPGAPTAPPASAPGRSRNAENPPRPSNTVKRDPLAAKQTTSRGSTPGTGQSNGSAPLKRKAEADLDPARVKAQRTETEASRNNAQPKTTGTGAAQPYRGTAGLSKSTLAGKPAPPAAKPVNAPVAQTAAKPTIPRPAPAATVGANGQAKPPPKKGSYAEILARAATTQTTAVGIKHKTIEEIKKEKAKVVPPEKTKAKADSRGKPAQRRVGSADVQSGSEKEKAGTDKTRKSAAPGYQGTARSVPTPAARPAYQGTMGLKRPDVVGRGNGIGRGKHGPASKRHAYYEDEDEEDEEDDYASDGSSDMEANIFDVDREEEEALRAARREDADEQAKLEQLEREKKRKRQLAVAQAVRERKERRRFM